MVLTDMEDAKMVSDAIRWRRTYYRFFIFLFFACIIVFAIVLITTPTKTGICMTEGSCSNFATNSSCSVNKKSTKTISNFNGFECSNYCTNDKRTYKCRCDELNVWEQRTISCSIMCIDALTTYCEANFSGQHCYPCKDVNGGFDCLTKCLNGIISFYCQCPAPLVWNNADKSCYNICPVEAIEVCNNNFVNIPCINSLQVKSSKCHTICANNSVSFACQCESIPVRTIWSLTNKACVYVCQNGLGNCVDYLDGKKCLASGVNENQTCNNKCSGNKRSFSCSCPLNYNWNDQKLLCDMNCPDPIVAGCSSANENINCVTARDLKGGKYCKTKCYNSNIDYKCSCPDIKLWSFQHHECQLECLNEEGDCSKYPDANMCVPKTDVNRGFNCMTNCAQNKSFTCSCPDNYKWNKERHTCNLICPSPPTAGCAIADGGIDCLSDQDLNGGIYCKTKCEDSLLDFECICPLEPYEMIWTKKYNQCVTLCQNGIGNCADYVGGKRCLVGKFISDTQCETKCSGDQMSFICSCQPNYVWNDRNLYCDLICPSPATSGCNLINENIYCLTTHDTKGGKFCETRCNKLNLDFECICPDKKLWSFQQSECQLECKNDDGNCTDYADASPCVTQKDVNGGFDCLTNCTDNKRSFSCTCPINYIWNKYRYQCDWICSSTTNEVCVKADEGSYCHPNQDLNGGILCQTKCNGISKDFVCICPLTPFKKIWSKIEHQCILECLNENVMCADDYANDKSCIATMCTNGGTSCSTLCSPSTRSFKCTCPSNRIWIQDDLSCILKCSNDPIHTNCLDYPKGEKCLLTSDIYNGTECTTKCSSTDGSDFICLCNEAILWNPIDHFCPICPPGFTFMSASRICYKVESIITNTFSEAEQLCNALRTYLPIVSSYDEVVDLSNFVDSNSLTSLFVNNIIFKKVNIGWIPDDNLLSASVVCQYIP